MFEDREEQGSVAAPSDAATSAVLHPWVGPNEVILTRTPFRVDF